MEKKQFWTLRYALINITYFAAFCTVHAYAAVYLLDKGFTNTQIGILLALANVVSAILQPVVAGIIDRPGPVTNRIVIMCSSLFILLASVLLLIVNDNKVIIFIVFAMIYMIQFVYQPVVTALYFEYEKAGANIMYGLARGLGSAGFATVSAFIGNVVEKKGVYVLLIGNIIIMCFALIVVYTFKKPLSADCGNKTSDDEVKKEAHNNIKEFAKIYPMFMLLVVATICFFFAHNMINDFLIQIIRPLGGGEAQLGYATFLAAFLELPVMAVIATVMKKISVEKLLIFSGVFFLIKTLILVFASNMAAVYISQACQMFAYAVFIPASAYYVNKIMDTYDQVKGQAYISSAITVGGVFSNLVSGKAIDKYGVSTTLIIGCVVAAIGVVIAVKALGLRTKSELK